MEKTPLRHLEAVADQRSMMSMRKTSFTIAPERKVVGTATMMQMPRTW
jgi:hypothetical protein